MLSHFLAGDTSVPSDPVALMEFYMKKAAQEERKRPPRQSKDEMPPPPSLQGTFAILGECRDFNIYFRHLILVLQVLLRRDTTWVTLSLQKNLKSSWHVVTMLKRRRLPKKLPRRLRFKQTILGTNFYLRWAGGKVSPWKLNSIIFNNRVSGKTLSFFVLRNLAWSLKQNLYNKQ